MVVELLCHPLTPTGLVRGVQVTIARGESATVLTYAIDADPGVVVQSSGIGERRDGLWQATCAEFFVATAGDPAYREFNFAPAGDWAAYDFTGPRLGQRDASVVTPMIRTAPGAILTIAATVETGVPGAWACQPTMVIATTDGAKSYWAARHPSGAPDFHARDCFCVHVSPPGAA